MGLTHQTDVIFLKNVKNQKNGQSNKSNEHLPHPWDIMDMPINIHRLQITTDISPMLLQLSYFHEMQTHARSCIYEASFFCPYKKAKI